MASSDTILLADLPNDTTEQDIQRMCSECGQVAHIRLLPGQRCGFCQFSKHEDAAVAVQMLTNCTLKGRPIIVAYAGPEFRNGAE